MKRTILIISILAVAGLLIAACGGTGAAPEAKPNTLVVAKVDQLAMDASADFWSKAPKLEVATKAAKDGNPDGPTVTLQAVHDGSNIVFRAEWADDTESVMKNAWTWNGSEFEKSGNEDRIMFVWPIGNNAEFASKGCTVACHNTADDSETWWMGADSEDTRYDAWQWKASRTNAAGYIDDKWWGTQQDAADVESAHHGDAKDSGGYKDNRTEDKSGPLWMSSKGADAQFIFAGEEIDIDTSTLKEGDIIPGYVLEKPTGSRGDIDAQGVWSNGKWVVVFSRALNTGHDDDAVFTPSKPIPFGMSVVDNGGGVNHTVAPDVLTMDWQ